MVTSNRSDKVGAASGCESCFPEPFRSAFCLTDRYGDSKGQPNQNRPGGTIDHDLCRKTPVEYHEPNVSIVPPGRAHLGFGSPPLKVVGYCHRVPAGRHHYRAFILHTEVRSAFIQSLRDVGPKSLTYESCRLGSASYRILMRRSPDPPTAGERTFAITLTFHGDLVLFLGRAERNRPIRRLLSHKTSVKDLIEACGIPHPEVDLIIANGRPVDFSFPLNTDVDLEIYTVPAPEGLFPEFRLQARDVSGFVADGHLGKLTRDLRLLGIDMSYRCDARDSELLVIAVRESRALLTRDRRLLMHRAVKSGYYPRSQDPIEQTVEVIKRFNLIQKLAPFQRCLHCNERLNPVPKETVLDELEPLTRLYYHEFRRCPKCGQIYWRGSHFDHLQNRVQAIMESIA
jgi:uncharacterized protein